MLWNIDIREILKSIHQHAPLYAIVSPFFLYVSQ